MSIFSTIQAQIAGANAAAAEGIAVAGINVAMPEPVDVEQKLVAIHKAKGSPNLNWRTSIADLMRLLDLDPSLDNRKELATELGYAGAKDGSAEMNIWLYKQVMHQLEQNGGIVPAALKG